MMVITFLNFTGESFSVNGNFYRFIARIGMYMTFCCILCTYKTFLSSDGNLTISFFRMQVFGNVTRLIFHGNSRQNQCICCTEHDNRCQTHKDTVPAFFLLMCFYILICLRLHINFHLSLTTLSKNIKIYYNYNGPKFGKGQTLNTIFPTICSSDTQPTAVFLESTEVERWSPIQKYRLAGT